MRFCTIDRVTLSTASANAICMQLVIDMEMLFFQILLTVLLFLLWLEFFYFVDFVATTTMTNMNIMMVLPLQKTTENGSFTLVCYVPSPWLQTPVKTGKPIIVPNNLFKEVTSFDSFADLTNSTAQRFVFVTGASSTYFQHSLTLISILQKRFPGRKLIYNDLGLNYLEAGVVS